MWGTPLLSAGIRVRYDVLNGKVLSSRSVPSEMCLSACAFLLSCCLLSLCLIAHLSPGSVPPPAASWHFHPCQDEGLSQRRYRPHAQPARLPP